MRGSMLDTVLHVHDGNVLMLAVLRSLAASWRFGRAGRLHVAGDLQGALILYCKNRRILAAAATFDPPDLSMRVLNLVRLAQASLQLGRGDLARSALEEWLEVREGACRAFPAYEKTDMFAKWDGWVRRTLSDLTALPS